MSKSPNFMVVWAVLDGETEETRHLTIILYAGSDEQAAIKAREDGDASGEYECVCLDHHETEACACTGWYGYEVQRWLHHERYSEWYAKHMGGVKCTDL